MQNRVDDFRLSDKRIALCFSGHVRSWSSVYSGWVYHVLNYYENVDVFMHLWDTEGFKVVQHVLPKGHSGIDAGKPICIEDLSRVFNPRRIQIEKYYDFHSTFEQISNRWYERLYKHNDRDKLAVNRPLANISMWYKWERCNNLKSEFEKDVGFKYDVVIRSRLDFRVNSYFPIAKYLELGGIVTPPWPPSPGDIEIGVDYKNGIQDYWAFGPSNFMDIYCNIFPNLDFLWDLHERDYDFEWIINPHKVPVMWMNSQGVFLEKEGGYVKHDEMCGALSGNYSRRKVTTAQSKKVKKRMNKMNVLIPMAGKGTRFIEEGYKEPKPLIPVRGGHMIHRVIANLYHPEIKFIFAALREHVQEYKMDRLLREVTKNKCEVILIPEVTGGPASTCLTAKSFINNDTPLVIVNADQIIEDLNWLSFWKVIDDRSVMTGMFGTFESVDPKNSYVRVDEYGWVTEAREKEVISNIATNGLHWWKHGRLFVESAEEMIAADDRVNGEFYVAPTFNYLIEKGHKVGIYEFKKHYPIGTPKDLQAYEKQKWMDKIND